MAILKQSEFGGCARTCPWSARASSGRCRSDGALTIANFILETLRRGIAMGTRGRPHTGGQAVCSPATTPAGSSLVSSMLIDRALSQM
jgi:hypothetical protein